MGISDRWLKRGTETPRCPMCKNLLYISGDIMNFITKTKEEIWLCSNPKCEYKRSKMFNLE